MKTRTTSSGLRIPNCTRPTSRSGADESDTSAILCEKYQWTIDRSNYDQVDVRVVHKDRDLYLQLHVYISLISVIPITKKTPRRNSFTATDFQRISSLYIRLTLLRVERTVCRGNTKKGAPKIK